MTHKEKITDALSIKVEAGCFHPDLYDNTCPTRYGDCMSCPHCRVSMTGSDYFALREAAQASAPESVTA